MRHSRNMLTLIIGMLICVGLAVAVVAVVAVPAHREGRDLLTPRGEGVMGAIKDLPEAAKDAAKAKFDRSDKAAE